MIRAVITFLLLIFLLCSKAQFLEGNLYTEDGEALIGATVQIKKENIGVVTDVDGHFKLPVPSFPVNVVFRSIGHTQQEHTYEEYENISLTLASNALGLDEVVVTGTMSPTMITNSPVKVEVVTSKYLTTYLPSAAASLIDGIKMINGVQEVVACGVCFTNSISINGLPGPYTAVLLDGSPIYGNLASVYGLNGIPNMIIDRFEVIKGPNSTLYGSEAMAGVINIITKKPEEQPPFSVDIMGTTHGESFGNISTSFDNNTLSGFLGLNYAIISGFDDQNEDGFGDRINVDRYSLFSKLNIKRKNNRTFSLASKWLYEDRRNGVKEFIQDRAYRTIRGNDSIYGESIYTYRGEVFGSYEVLDNQKLKLDYSLSHHSQNSFYGADLYKATQSIGFLNLVAKHGLKKHLLTLGLTNRLQFYDDNTVATEEISNGEVNNKPDNSWIPGVFIQDEYELNNWFTLLGGLRLDHYHHHGFITSPRLSTKYKPSPWSTFRLNFGTGFRVVNLFTEDHAFITGQREVIISEALEPERSTNLAFNFNQIFTLGNSQGMIDVDGYYSIFSNKIIPDYDDPESIIYANTNGRATSRGVGLTLSQEFLQNVSLTAGVNFQQVFEEENNNKTNIEFSPDYSALFNINYRLFKPEILFAYSMRLTGPMQLPAVYEVSNSGDINTFSRPTKSKTYSFHSLQITWQKSHHFSLYGGIQNIFDFRQAESPLVGFNDQTAPPGFSQSFDTSYSYAPIHGREFYLGIQWNYNKKGS